MITLTHIYLGISLAFIYCNKRLHFCVSAKKPWQIDYPQDEYFNPDDIARIMMNKKLNLQSKNIIHHGNYTKYDVYKVLRNKLLNVNLMEETRVDFLKNIYNRSRERKHLVKESKKKRNTEHGSKKTNPPSLKNDVDMIRYLNDYRKRKFFLSEGSGAIWREPLIMSNCWIQKMLSEKYEFSPSCNSDGSFQNKQCYLKRCWCTNEYGQLKLVQNRFYFGISALNLECLD